MTKIIMTLFAITFPLQISFAQETKYINSNYNFSLTLPYDWEEIPKEVIDETLKTLIQQSNKEIEFA